MTDREKLKHCAGCYNDDYNHGLGGSHRCWMLDSMEIIWRKKVAMDQVPPWTQKAQRYPKCYRRSGYVFVGAHQEH